MNASCSQSSTRRAHIPLQYASYHRTGKARLHTSAHRNTHYQTLSLPRNASRNQIKSSFYKLSKLYHPDVAKDVDAKEKFQKVSEAYAVLGDERKRRAYDRTLQDGRSGAGYTTYAEPSRSSHPGYWAYETRRKPGATHAWDYARRPPHGQRYPPPPGAGPYRSSPYTHPQAGPEHHRDPFESPHVQRATGHTRRPRGPSEGDEMHKVSSFWRAMQVIGVVMFVATVGGGFRANA